MSDAHEASNLTASRCELLENVPPPAPTAAVGSKVAATADAAARPRLAEFNFAFLDVVYQYNNTAVEYRAEVAARGAAARLGAVLRGAPAGAGRVREPHRARPREAGSRLGCLGSSWKED